MVSTDGGSDEVRSDLISDSLRHHLRLFVVCALVGLAAGFALSAHAKATYTSQASVLINPLLGNPYSPDGAGDSLTNLETEAQLVRSDVLAQRVSKQTHVPATELQNHLNVSVPVNTQILQISYDSADRDQTDTVVNAYADDFLASRERKRNSLVRGQASTLRQQITIAQAKLRAASAKAQQGDAFAAKLAQTLAGQLASLRIQSAQVSTSATNAGEVISPGVRPTSPSGLPLLLLLAAGLIAGLLVAALLAVSRERSSHVLRHVGQVQETGIPVLGIMSGRRGEDRAAVYRLVRASLGDKAPISLAVAACGTGSPAGIIAAELAVTTTRSGKVVALVDAVGTASQLLTSSEAAQTGLSDVLVNPDLLDQALVRFSPGAKASMLLLVPGENFELAAERYASKAMANLLADLASEASQVLVSAPNLGEPDGSALAAQTAGVLMIVTLNRSSHADLVTAKDWLERTHTAVIGAIVVKRGRMRSSTIVNAYRQVAELRTKATTEAPERNKSKLQILSWRFRRGSEGPVARKPPSARNA
jgi:succinoglycan biosynthesis transport protein ExoP